MISYDGVHPDYGTSSLLYVWLLAALRILSTSPVLPRAVSSFFHVLLFAGLAWELPKALRSAPKVAWSLGLVLLALLITPMAVRWLDDGMETSLTLCLVALMAFAVSRLGHSEVLHKRSIVWLLVLGFIATLTRVEYLLLMGVSSVTLLLTWSEQGRFVGTPPRTSPSPRRAAVAFAPLTGSLLAAGLIFVTMHALVPDTAIAKADLGAPWMPTLFATVSVLASSMSMGFGLFLFWLLTAGSLITQRRKVSLSILVANSLFPIVFVLAADRGQQVQGVRYFLWTLLFPILWNILELRWGADHPSTRRSEWQRVVLYLFVGLIAVSVPVESVLLYKEFRAREQSLSKFRAQNLESLHSLKLVAFDVGYIGYFTNSPVCDMAGLVNGRIRAALPFEERVKACVAEHPQYAFVSGFSLWELNHAEELKGWSLCSEYNLANTRSADMHYLIASPAATPEVCAAAGSAPRLLQPLMNGGLP
jgi:hypothetical protein